jgi:hypothetical protein
MIAIMPGPLIVSPAQAFRIMIQQVPTIFTMMMIGQTFLTTVGTVLTGMIGLQVGLTIVEVVRGIVGAVPIEIAKFGL